MIIPLVSYVSRAASRVSLVLGALLGVASAQETREPSPAGDLVAVPSWTGTWQFQFHVVHQAVSPAACATMVEQIGVLRQSVATEALESLVHEQQYFRGLVGKGREKLESTSSVTFTVQDDTTFHERTDLEGGWQKGGAIGQTQQTLRTGGDLLWVRSDTSRPGDFVQEFHVAEVDGKQGANDGVLAAETTQHVVAINYCARRGARGEGGETWTVAREVYAKDPPCGLALLYVGTTMVMRRSMQGGRVSFVVTLFDGTGRTCKEWTSEWVGGRPRLLEEREHFSVGSAINMRRQLRVVDFDAKSKVPDVVELAMTPFERRVALDYRQPGSPAFDPVAGAPVLTASASRGFELHGEMVAAVREAAAAKPKAKATQVAASLERESTGGAPAPTAIPVDPETRASFAWPLLLAVGLLASLLGLGAWRWRSGRWAGAVVLVLCTLPLAACDQVHAQAPLAESLAGDDASGQPALEVVPASLSVPPAKQQGELRRCQLALVNNLAESIEIVQVLPSCGCVRIEGGVQGLQLEPFDGQQFEVWIDMDDFHKVELDVAWRTVGPVARRGMCKGLLAPAP